MIVSNKEGARRDFRRNLQVPSKPWIRGAGADSSALALCTKLMGGDDQEQWEQMKRLYASLFSDVIPKDVPPRLKDLFTYVAATREERLNIFGNRAGKSFAKEPLGLLPIKRWVRTSTTPTPQTGVHTPQLCGVVHEGHGWLSVKSRVTMPLPSPRYWQGCRVWRVEMAPGHMVRGLVFLEMLHEGFSNAGFAVNILLPRLRDKVLTILEE